MKIRMYTDEQYDKALWNMCWQKAEEYGRKRNWSKNAIVKYLSEDLGISEVTIWRSLRMDFLRRHGTRRLLLDYLGYENYDKFKNEIDTNTKKQIIIDNKHIFISYKDFDKVKKIVSFLKENSIAVWIDKESLMPGEDWQNSIQKAIENGMFFMACFSKNYWSNRINYMNEELQIAIDQLRKMPDDQVWFLPIKLDDCDIPHFQIRQNKTLASKQFIKLYEDWENGMQKILSVIRK